MSEQTEVSVTLGYTLNLGNFQSLRIDIGVRDFKRNAESINEATERIYTFVENKLIEKVEEAKREM